MLWRKQAPAPAPITWRREWEDGLDYLEHGDGLAWFDVPRPSGRHYCWAQTRGRFGFELVERCPCGAARLDGDGPWIDRNSRTT